MFLGVFVPMIVYGLLALITPFVTVGLAVILIALIVLTVLWIRRRKKRKQVSES